MNNYVYEVGGNLYINLTNKCTNNCGFCIRHNRQGMNGTNLWLDSEPTFSKVKEQLDFHDLTKYGQIVMCGFGEPTCNLDVLLEAGRYLKGIGKFVRLNTNGHGNVFNGKDITPELKNAVNQINISLNASNAQKYNEICNSVYGADGFDRMLDFAEKCRINGIDVVFSVVDTIGQSEIENCKSLAGKLNIPLRVRKFE